MKRWLLFLALLGAGDLATGSVLLLRPGWVLGPLGVALPDPDIYLRWIGVFVAAIGAATLVPWFDRDAAAVVARMRQASEITARIRFAIAAFVGFAVLAGGLPTGFAFVGAWDGLAALAQRAFERRGRRVAAG